MQSQNLIKTAGLVAAGVVVYNVLVKGKALGSINFISGNVHSLALQGTTPVLTVGVIAQNTSSQKFVVRSIAGNVSADGYLIGYVSYFGQTEILPNSQVQIYVPIVLSPLGIVQDIINAFQTNNSQQEIEFKGYANVDNFQVPVDNKYKVGI